MNITINGDIYITAYGQTLDEIVGNNEDLDLPFDFLDDEDDYCEESCDDCNCEDCGFYEEEDEGTDIDEIVDELTSIYADILDDVCECFDCRKSALTDLIKDFVNAL